MMGTALLVLAFYLKENHLHNTTTKRHRQLRQFKQNPYDQLKEEIQLWKPVSMCKRERGGRYSQGSPSVEEESPDQTAFLNDLEAPGDMGEERRVLTGQGAPEPSGRTGTFKGAAHTWGKAPPRLPDRHQCL